MALTFGERAAGNLFADELQEEFVGRDHRSLFNRLPGRVEEQTLSVLFQDGGEAEFRFGGIVSP